MKWFLKRFLLGLILCATLIFSTYENEFHWFWSPIHFYLLPTVSTALANQNWSVEIFEILKIHSISSNSDKYPPPTVLPEDISFASSSLTSEITSQNTFTLSRWQICHCPTVLWELHFNDCKMSRLLLLSLLLMALTTQFAAGKYILNLFI